jgi:hypothetical protein
VSASHRPAHALTLNVIGDLLAGGSAAGVFNVEDPEATAVLCWASTHGFDPDFNAAPAPADSRLIRAAQQLFRRAAGIPAGAPRTS